MGKLSFGTTGLSYQVDKVALNVGGAPKCPRCRGNVYFNEEKKAMGKSWHTKCFNCAKCHKSLDSTNANTHEDEIYCTACHRREFGPKGYGFAGGASGLSTESTFHKVRPVPQVQTHTVPQLVQAKSLNHADPNCCPRCGKRVHFAEEMRAMKRKWHRLCFKCATCNKMLEPGRSSENEGELYCSACYGRQFGPKGYGFAGGAGQTLSSDVHPLYPNFGRKSRASSSSLSRDLDTSRPLEEARWARPSSSGTPSPGASSSSSISSPPSFSNPNSTMYPSGSSTMYPCSNDDEASNNKAYSNGYASSDRSASSDGSAMYPAGSRTMYPSASSATYSSNGYSMRNESKPMYPAGRSKMYSATASNDTMYPSSSSTDMMYPTAPRPAPPRGLGGGDSLNEYAAARPLPPSPQPTGQLYEEQVPFSSLPNGLPRDTGSSKYYGAKEWDEPVFL